MGRFGGRAAESRTLHEKTKETKTLVCLHFFGPILRPTLNYSVLRVLQEERPKVA